MMSISYTAGDAREESTTIPALASDPQCCAKLLPFHSHRDPVWACTSPPRPSPSFPPWLYWHMPCPLPPARSRHLSQTSSSCFQPHSPPVGSPPIPSGCLFQVMGQFPPPGLRASPGWWSKSVSPAKATDTKPGTGVQCVWLLDKTQETEGLSRV